MLGRCPGRVVMRLKLIVEREVSSRVPQPFPLNGGGGAPASFGKLPGGAPRADYAKMGKAELMAAAKDLGVNTRIRGNWRRVDEVCSDCEVKLADS